LREALLLGGVSLLLTAVVWIVRPDRLPLRAQAETYELELAAPVVSVADAVAHFAAGTHLFVDVREQLDGEGIPGSFRVRSSAFDGDLAEVRDFLYPENDLILYDDGVMQLASAAAVRFQERGFANVTILQGGLAAWQSGGGTVAGEDAHDLE
jgi:rhodanese-related sulfurtransferase